MKLNADGASKNNPGLFGIGGILRDSHAYFVKAYMSYICIQTSFVADVQAVYEGLKLAVEVAFVTYGLN